MSLLDDDFALIEDDDGGTESDSDICERCDHTRGQHENGIGKCECGKCKKFKD